MKENARRVREAKAKGVVPKLLPVWHPSQLRHAHATTVRKLFGLEAAQVVLGYERADVTQVYAEWNAELAAEVARKVG